MKPNWRKAKDELKFIVMLWFLERAVNWAPSNQSGLRLVQMIEVYLKTIKEEL